MFPRCFPIWPKLCQKCNKNIVLSYFCYFLYENVSWRCFIFAKKMWQKSVKGEVFVSFLTLFWNLFCQNLNTILHFDTFLLHFRTIFVTFLIHFGFWYIFVRFLQIFVSFWSHFCVLSHFCQNFDDFCYIFVTFLSHFWNGGTNIDKEYRYLCTFSVFLLMIMS